MRISRKKDIIACAGECVFLISLLLPLKLAAGQFVEVTAQIETAFWSSEGLTSFYYKLPTGSSPRAYTVHCVVGTNRWRMDGDVFSRNAKVSWWFTGSNLISQTLLAPGTKFVQNFESADGNPSKPKGESDLLELTGRIAWLAFCSGPCLKREERRLFPLNNFWKEFMDAPSGFSDNRWCYKDALGLPEAFSLYTASDQPMVQYRVTTSTNVFGWQFPLEFSLVEYRPAPLTHGMELDLIAKGHVTQIGVGTEPEVPRGIEESSHE